MTTYELDDAELGKLKDKTILITGGASGIGLAAARTAYEHEASLAIGDWNEPLGHALVQELGSTDRVLFRKTDVSQWDDVLSLFEEAHAKYGNIHAVLSNAGTNKESLLKDESDPDTGRLLAPDLKTYHSNLTAQLYVVKCAMHFMSKAPETRCQIVMTGSAASYFDTPPIYQYCASKAGVLGLMRGLRSRKTHQNVTVNMVAPWMTETPMLSSFIRDVWEGLPANKPEGVARALLLPVVRPDLNGKSFFVAGHKIVEFEDKLKETAPLWMGQELCENVAEGQRRIATGKVRKD